MSETDAPCMLLSVISIRGILSTRHSCFSAFIAVRTSNTPPVILETDERRISYKKKSAQKGSGQPQICLNLRLRPFSPVQEKYKHPNADSFSVPQDLRFLL